MWYSNSLIGSSSPLGGTGTASVSYGPVDHSIPTQSGTAGLKTDGVSGCVDLRTAFGYLTGLKDSGQFAIVAIANIASGNGNWARLASAESVNNTGWRFMHTNAVNTLSSVWDGGAVDTTLMTDDTLHSVVNSFDVTNENYYVAIDGTSDGEDLSGTITDVIQQSLIGLGHNPSTGSDKITANYGFTAILDLSGVTTVDATFTTNLAAAIAGVTSFDPTLIAQAIYGVDNGIDGIYYSLDEASKNVDASDYYLLAYDVTDQSAKTSGYYGLTSAAGVEGITIFEEGCPFGRNRSMDTIFRGRRF